MKQQEVTREQTEIIINAEVSKKLEKHSDKRLFGMWSLLPKVLCNKPETNTSIEVFTEDPMAWQLINELIRSNLNASLIKMQIISKDRVLGIEQILKQETKHKLILSARSRFAIVMIETSDNTTKVVVWELPE